MSPLVMLTRAVLAPTTVGLNFTWNVVVAPAATEAAGLERRVKRLEPVMTGLLRLRATEPLLAMVKVLVMPPEDISELPKSVALEVLVAAPASFAMAWLAPVTAMTGAEMPAPSILKV